VTDELPRTQVVGGSSVPRGGRNVYRFEINVGEIVLKLGCEDEDERGAIVTLFSSVVISATINRYRHAKTSPFDDSEH
jgi:hypothetical protein